MRLALILGAIPRTGKVTGYVRVERGTWIVRHNAVDSIINLIVEHHASPTLSEETLVIPTHDKEDHRIETDGAFVSCSFHHPGKEPHINVYLERVE